MHKSALFIGAILFALFAAITCLQVTKAWEHGVFSKGQGTVPFLLNKDNLAVISDYEVDVMNTTSSSVKNRMALRNINPNTCQLTNGSLLTCSGVVSGGEFKAVQFDLSTYTSIMQGLLTYASQSRLVGAVVDSVSNQTIFIAQASSQKDPPHINYIVGFTFSTNTENLSEKWHFTVGDSSNIDTFYIDQTDNSGYILSYSKLIKLDLLTGRVIYNADTVPASYLYPPAGGAVTYGGRILFPMKSNLRGQSGPALVSFDASTGAFMSFKILPGSFIYGIMPSITKKSLFVLTDTNFVGYNLAADSVQWAVESTEKLNFARVFATSVNGQDLALFSLQSTTYVLSANDGSQLFSLKSTLGTRVATTDGLIYSCTPATGTSFCYKWVISE